MSGEALADLQAVWEAHATADPLWAILSEDSKRRRGWDLSSFLATGEEFVEKVMGRFRELGYEPRGCALDFGCGVGRLTQPLAARFDHVVGIDISPTMVELARRLNRYGDRVTYVLNAGPELEFVPSASIDFGMSFITLQHIPPDAARLYLTELVRVLRPGACLFFQVPSHRNDQLVDGNATGALAPNACRADIEVASAPTALTAGESLRIHARVTNRSADMWVSTAEHPIRLGNHWFRDGSTAVHDDGRAGLPSRLPPGGSVDVELIVTAPTEPSAYELALDVVQEGVRWFGDLGHPCLRLPVRVGNPSESGAAEVPGATSAPIPDPLAELLTQDWNEPPAFSMFGIPRAEIEGLLHKCGATIIADEKHLDDWVSYGYYVVRAR